MNAPQVSVVLCTHNPRGDYLDRTLAALREQTLPPERWEFLLVDNASPTPLAAAWTERLPRNGRIVVESTLGLTPARIRGIAETRGDVIVFVDDDNVLAGDYLHQAWMIACEKPFVGAWGGVVTPLFESRAPDWLTPYLPLLAVNAVPRDVWSNCTDPSGTPPCGAGMCVRRHVAKCWAENVRTDPRRLALGRAGASLASCEDIDLAFTACDLGQAAGRFTTLRLTHLIPARRVSIDYMARLVEEVTASQVIFRSLRESLSPEPEPRLLERALRLWHRFRAAPESVRLRDAAERGRRRGFAQLAELNRIRAR